MPKPTPIPQKPASLHYERPQHITMDVRKFALSQAVKTMGGGVLGGPIIDLAAQFEDYVLNGKKN